MAVFESNRFHGVFITDFTSCFFFSSVLMFFCFKTCSARSLLNCCSPHNFQFLSHDFPRAGGGRISPLADGRQPLPEGQLPQRAAGVHRSRLQKPFPRTALPRVQGPRMGDLMLLTLLITPGPISRLSTPLTQTCGGGVRKTPFVAMRWVRPEPMDWMCVSSQIPVWEPSPHGDGVRRCGLWETTMKS
uniref:Uncharacterized protein n=1 Tax=Myotis myotis TaxID=51298 RepID=A0A7J7VI93_MYOMY|nr:hypothetical protein mMyoMyo1_008377 [Myotis myotis]